MFIIIDWTGRVLFNGQEFEDFETAWGFIYENIPEEYEGDGTYDDVFVVETDSMDIRETRYLEPNHPNNGHVAVKKGKPK